MKDFDASKIPEYIKIGAQDKLWYSDHQELFEKLFGKSKLQLVTQLFAATSINSSLTSNVRLFRRALYEIENEKPFGNYLPVMKIQLERIRAGEPMSGRKINSFAKAMSGDPNAVVVDIWLLRAFGVDNRSMRYQRNLNKNGYIEHVYRERSGGATNRQYDWIEAYVREEANKMAVEPRQLSAMIWSGVRTATTGSKQTRYKEVLVQQMFNMFDL